MVVQSAQKSEFLRGLEEVIGSPPPPLFLKGWFPTSNPWHILFGGRRFSLHQGPISKRTEISHRINTSISRIQAFMFKMLQILLVHKLFPTWFFFFLIVKSCNNGKGGGGGFEPTWLMAPLICSGKGILIVPYTQLQQKSLPSGRAFYIHGCSVTHELENEMKNMKNQIHSSLFLLFFVF